MHLSIVLSEQILSKRGSFSQTTMRIGSLLLVLGVMATELERFLLIL